MKNCVMPEDNFLACELPDLPRTCHRPGSGACAAGKVNFLQVNLNGNWAAEQLIFQTSVKMEADLLIVSEPFRHHVPEDL